MDINYPVGESAFFAALLCRTVAEGDARRPGTIMMLVVLFDGFREPKAIPVN